MSASNVHSVNVKVMREDDEDSPEKRANAFLDDDDDDNTSNLLPSEPPNTDYLMADIPSREAFFAILLFLFVSVALGMAYVIANNQMAERRMHASMANITKYLEKCEVRDVTEQICITGPCLKVGQQIIIIV